MNLSEICLFNAIEPYGKTLGIETFSLVYVNLSLDNLTSHKTDAVVLQLYENLPTWEGL